MILPSDDDSRKPGDGEPGDDPSGPPMPWDGGAFFDDSDGEEEDDGEDAAAGKIQSPAPPGWRTDLKLALLEAIEDLREIEDPDEEFDPPEPPDLFTFYGELVALRQEMRRGSRRASELLQKLTEDKAVIDGARPLAQALLALFDRSDAAQRAAVESVMVSAGLTRIAAGAGQPFDAACMVTADKVRKNAVTAGELEAGFLWRGQVLRPARVALA